MINISILSTEVNRAQLKSGHYFDGLVIKVWSIWTLNNGVFVWRTISARSWYQICYKNVIRYFNNKQNNKIHAIFIYALEYVSRGTIQ